MGEEPRGSGEPLYTIWEEYADSQTAWMRDFVPAMEKMLANGYPGGLTPAADHTTGVECPFPVRGVWGIYWACYQTEAAGGGPALVLRSDWISDRFQAGGKVVQAGEQREEMWSFTGEDNQLWVWSESGEQLLTKPPADP